MNPGLCTLQAQMGFVQHHDVVEALAAEGADEPFHVGILPRRPRRCLDVMDPCAGQELHLLVFAGCGGGPEPWDGLFDPDLERVNDAPHAPHAPGKLLGARLLVR
jgi:hypothetical protein